MKRLLFSVCLLGIVSAHAQYAPQALVTGSTAIHKSSTQFSSWASGCIIQRGLQQITDPSLGYVTAGDPTAAIGLADGTIVSLGDSGVAVLTFVRALSNGPGPDFAVFENGFPNTANPEEAFLELAFVEVSSDGVNFTRFPAISKTQDTAQLSSVAGSMFMNARLLNNLAGKYIGTWGTPFDLDELSTTPGLDVNSITHIRIVDVIGSLGMEGTTDGNGRKINDPFPTPFPAGGFDLDGVGVIHSAPTAISAEHTLVAFQLYPNPAGDLIHLQMGAGSGLAMAKLFDVTGRVLQQHDIRTETFPISLTDLAPGAYYLTIRTESGATCTRPFLHR